LTTSALTLFWTPLLLGAMGKPLNGLFLSFQSVAQLGGLGDLGMGGAVAIKAGQCLGENKPEALQNFLASARTVFLLLGLMVSGSVLLLSPGLPHWLHFRAEEGAGPLPWLFAIGSINVCM